MNQTRRMEISARAGVAVAAIPMAMHVAQPNFAAWCADRVRALEPGGPPGREEAKNSEPRGVGSSVGCVGLAGISGETRLRCWRRLQEQGGDCNVKPHGPNGLRRLETRL